MACGERLHTIWEFKELLAQGSSQYVRPDLGLAGGFTQVRKIAALAEAQHSAVVTHNFLGPVITAASIHLDVSIPNFVIQEYRTSDEDPTVHPALTSTLKREGGYMLTPAEPGLGVTLDPAALLDDAYNDFVGDIAQAPIRADGSIAAAV